MSLLDDLAAAEERSTNKPRCSACAALAGVSDDVRPAVEQALSGTIGARRLAQILTSHGHPTGPRTVLRHRREAH